MNKNDLILLGRLTHEIDKSKLSEKKKIYNSKMPLFKVINYLFDQMREFHYQKKELKP